MIKKIFLYIILFAGIIIGQSYPDQFYTYQNDRLISQIESMSDINISSDGNHILLSDDATSGFVVFWADSSTYPFDRGLPSWNGNVPNGESTFRVKVRFYKNGWSPWLTAGYWKDNIWSSYGATSFADGEIDYDYVVLKSFYSKWQFKLEMKRTAISKPSPSFNKLSFFISDQRTTDNVVISQLVNDKPAQIFIATDHFYQYGLDPGIGGDICSPTSVSMVLRSFGIEVDPLQFAKDNYDPYWGIYGMWPRAVQNAAEYNLDGAVTRYRTWSEAYKVLAAGGRIVMSVGRPLYAGHLMMLAGFDAYGNPLVHDPAISNGYGYKHNKTELTESWFNKGGISYTFFLEDTSSVVSVKKNDAVNPKNNYALSIYPNPFNPGTNINLHIQESSYTEIIVYDITGREIDKIYKDMLAPGSYNFRWNASEFPSGMYLIRAISGEHIKTMKAFLIK